LQHRPALDGRCFLILPPLDGDICGRTPKDDFGPVRRDGRKRPTIELVMSSTRLSVGPPGGSQQRPSDDLKY
jgi:hypothetical protein